MNLFNLTVIVNLRILCHVEYVANRAMGSLSSLIPQSRKTNKDQGTLSPTFFISLVASTAGISRVGLANVHCGCRVKGIWVFKRRQ